MSAERAVAVTLFAFALCSSAQAAEAEEETPDLDFLEYLGMWEETDEDWQMFEETMTSGNEEERSDPAPEGEESTEKEDAA